MVYPYILMIFVVIFYAGNILIGKAINELPPFTIAFLRLVVAFIVLLPIGYRKAWQYRLKFLEYKKPFLVMTLTGVTFFNTIIYGALQFTTSTNVAVIETVIPVATVALGAFLIKEKLQPLQLVGIFLSLFGALWVVLNGNISNLATMDWNVGDGIMVGAIVCWAIYSILVKQYLHLFPPYAALLVMTGVSVIVLFPIVVAEWFVTGVPSFVPSNLMGLAYLGIFPSFIALIFYNHSVEKLGASQAAVFINFLPVVTMIGASIWLGEEMTGMKVIGAWTVISGVLLTTQIKARDYNKGLS
ncbi:DMT family transporter [Virgibacillus byunsanensis]|uniref:DMT family transporter n=1 Tax=Virgibacillus byunsanensis TaxID=570945 RepID=A0ABW3LQ27_9BACI